MASEAASPVDVSDYAFVSWLRCILRALWVARISVLSVFAGFFLFIYVEQAQDLFLDSQNWTYWIVFYVCAAVFWLLPIHNSARSLLHLHNRYIHADTEERFFVLVEKFPRVLVVLALVAIFIGQLLALDNIPRHDVADPPANAAFFLLLGLLTTTAAVTVLTTLVMFWRKEKVARTWVDRYPRFSKGLAWCATALFVKTNFVRPDARTSYRSPFFTSKDYDREELESLIAAFVLGVIFVVLVAAVIFNPVDILPQCRRATMAVILLGGWVPLFHLFAYLSWRLRLPVTVLVVVPFAFISSKFLDNHNVRTLPGQGHAVKRPTLHEAAQLWRKVNCQTGPCPRPVIVVAEAGASRSAFFAGSVLGYLADHSPQGTSRTLHEQIFAISGVSGGSLAAATFVAAAEAKSLKIFPAKIADPKGEKLTFLRGSTAESGQKTQPATWQNFLQTVLAGDFLTPTVVRLGFNDVFRFPWTKDRAAILERSWESRFKLVTDAKADPQGVFARPFLSFVPNERRWLPLLILNGTSTADGRRLLTTTLEPENVFVDAIDMSTLIDPTHKGRDVRLSTAVTNSARFPYISPRGNVTDANGKIMTYVEDGGLFEFFGIASAVELARALKQRERDLDPFILLITSDPKTNPDACGESDGGVWVEPRQFKPGAHSPLLPGFFGPLDTLMQTRIARGYHSALSVGQEFPRESLALIQVCPSTDSTGAILSAKSLSMSWWLSNPVLAYLDAEVRAKHNAQSLADIECLLAKDPSTKRCRPKIIRERHEKGSSDGVETGAAPPAPRPRQP